LYVSTLSQLAAINGMLSLMRMELSMQLNVLQYADNLDVKTAGSLIPKKRIKRKFNKEMLR
jgi:hypothetical protein